MELFVVVNKSGEVVKGGFSNKKEAKEVRNQLQAETKYGLPKTEHRSAASAWDFKVSKGKDHDAFQK